MREFQSSPVPKDGCNQLRLQELQGEFVVSILTRPEGRVQPISTWRKHSCPQVSILTRPEGRVQPAGNRLGFGSPYRFNPHPSRRTGATWTGRRTGWLRNRVSILTRPEGRVQPRNRRRRPKPSGVSILTRPEGRVQPVGCNGAGSCARGFQSSPVPKDGCNHRSGMPLARRRRFQSSPVPKDGCNVHLAAPVHPAAPVVSILTRPEGRVQPVMQSWSRLLSGCFNPHPSRRTGATVSVVAKDGLLFEFQSSPVPKDGCNPVRSLRPSGAGRFQSSPVPKDGCNECVAITHFEKPEVSILTRPEGRVQPRRLGVRQLRIEFQSSPVPKDGCNHSTTQDARLRGAVSILTRPEGRVQLPRQSIEIRPLASFNPHPSRRTGATRGICDCQC